MEGRVQARHEHEERLGAGPLELRPEQRLATANGHALTLSVREFHLLVALARRSGAIVSREDLFATVWQQALRPGDRSVDVYVHKLRAKLEAALPEWRFIHTHVGFGYRFEAAPAQPQVAKGLSHAFHMDATAP